MLSKSFTYVTLCFLVAMGATAAAQGPNGDKHFDSYSNPDGRGVCYGHDFSGVFLALEDTVVVLNGARVCPKVQPDKVQPEKERPKVREHTKRIRAFAQELRARRREMIANKTAVADIRSEMIVQLERSDLVEPGSVKHRDYYPNSGEDHIWVQYKGRNSRTLLVFSYTEPERPGREEILESRRVSARNVFEALKADFENDRFVVFSSWGNQSFTPKIVSDVQEELAVIRSKQTAPTSDEWKTEKRFFSYEVAEQIRMPLNRAAFQQH